VDREAPDPPLQRRSSRCRRHLRSSRRCPPGIAFRPETPAPIIVGGAEQAFPAYLSAAA